MTQHQDTFYSLLCTLQNYWSGHGCSIALPYDMPMGAGTFHPCTFFAVLGSDPWRVAYAQPSRRPTDGRYGENPNRLYQHTQFQVILKPSPDTAQELYLESLRAIGIDTRAHDIRFEEDDWESPTLGATGLGWQVLCDGTEITQFTYFQQVAGIDLSPISVELTYGLERIAAFVQGVDHVMDIAYADNVCYRDMKKECEHAMSAYCFQSASVERHWQLFTLAEQECQNALDNKLALPAYEWLLQCSNWFNVLDARGAISVAERTRYIARIRAMARACARTHLALPEKVA